MVDLEREARQVAHERPVTGVVLAEADALKTQPRRKRDERPRYTPNRCHAGSPRKI
jgi:hypothetical protein